jgi:lysophospholipase L1-like esterase
VGIEPYLQDNLHGWSIHTSAAIGRPTSEGTRMIRAAGHLPQVIAVSLGTNDDPSRPELFRSAIASILRRAGSHRCVVWANIVRPPVGGVSYTRLNGVLRREARAHSNLRVVDWVKLSKKHPGWFAPGHVHVNAAGYRARAKAFAAQIRRCAS